MKAVKKIFVCLVIFFVVLTLSEINGNAQIKTRRFAMIVGANNGGSGRVVLKYAVSDALSMKKVLNKLGGISRRDTVMLLNPNRMNLISGLNKFHRLIRDAKKKYQRVEAIFYYSGHADETSILLYNQKVHYSELRGAIKKLKADVKIAILDSCSSGAFVRSKGGKFKAPFLIDGANNMKGYAFMSSSSANEVSQESDRIRGSFFTYYLVSGLRGAADVTQDGRITLNEAYQYAYNHTLTRTARTLSGPQHANYNIQMSGTGDVILTDVKKSSAGLVLGKTLQGKIYVINSKGIPVAELKKPYGQKIYLGLATGAYVVINDRNGVMYETKVTLYRRRRVTIIPEYFRLSKREITTVRKGGKKKPYIKKEFYFQLYPGDTNEKIETDFHLHLFSGYVHKVTGISLGPIVSIISDEFVGAQLSGIGNISGRMNMGFQGAGIFNITKFDGKGGQGAGIFNISGGNFKGIQWAGIFNISELNMKGFQSAGVFNITKKNIDGVQLSGIFNSAQNVNGFQGSLINVAGNVKGMQLGLINVSNKIDGLALGLINIVKNGRTVFSITYEDLDSYRLSLKNGGKYFYNIYTIAGSRKFERISAGLGYGFRIPLGPVYFEIDAIAHIMNETTQFFQQVPVLHAQSRLIFGWQIFKRFAAFAGVSYNYAHNFSGNDSVMPQPFMNKSLSYSSLNNIHWIGFFFGVQI